MEVKVKMEKERATELRMSLLSIVLCVGIFSFVFEFRVNVWPRRCWRSLFSFCCILTKFLFQRQG